MGRFETSAEFYAPYREAYPPELFRAVAERIPLRGTERLLDVACGPAMLALGFAPFVRSCAGIDVEATMIEAARRASAAAGIPLDLMQGRLEEIPDSAGTFDVATIGRALHWLDRDRSLGVFDRILNPGAPIVVCTALASENGSAWTARFRAVRESWSTNFNRALYEVKLRDWFAGSRFEKRDRIQVTYRHAVTVPELIGRALSMSPTSPAALGDRREAFESALRAELEPYAERGALEEEVLATATIFA